jgi:hypothetical protein
VLCPCVHACCVRWCLCLSEKRSVRVVTAHGIVARVKFVCRTTFSGAGYGEEHLSHAQHIQRSVSAAHRRPVSGFVSLPASAESAASYRAGRASSPYRASHVRSKSTAAAEDSAPAGAGDRVEGSKPTANPDASTNADAANPAPSAFAADPASQAPAVKPTPAGGKVPKLRLIVPRNDSGLQSALSASSVATVREDRKASVNAELMASLQSMQTNHAHVQHQRNSHRSVHSTRTMEAARSDVCRKSLYSVASSGRFSRSTSMAMSHQDVLQDGVKVRAESQRLRRQVSGFGINSAVRTSATLSLLPLSRPFRFIWGYEAKSPH